MGETKSVGALVIKNAVLIHDEKNKNHDFTLNKTLMKEEIQIQI